MTKQEPVAWLDDGHSSAEFAFSFEKGINHTIPLYTAPRELSDEEIKECFEMKHRPIYFYLDFAKAILKKASEI